MRFGEGGRRDQGERKRATARWRNLAGAGIRSPGSPLMEPLLTNNERITLRAVHKRGPAATIEQLWHELFDVYGTQREMVQRLNSLSRRGFVEKHWPTAFTLIEKGKKEIGVD